MAIKPVKKDNISNLAFEQLKEQIIKRDWKPGTKLPSENELARMLNVSRVTVRDSLRRLSTLGLVRTVNGEGSYVNEINPGVYINSLIPIFALGKYEILQVLEFRQIIEVETVGLAVEKASKKDVDFLENIFTDYITSKGNYDKFADNDMRFHLAIADITKNPLIIQLMYLVKDILDVSMQNIVKNLGTQIGEYYHKQILEAFKQKDQEKAKLIMSEHIKKTIESISDHMKK